MPLWPYWRNSQGLLSTLPTLSNWVGWTFILIGWPCSRVSRGLGSNVSTCDGPPSMNRKITLLAPWPRKCVGRGSQRIALQRVVGRLARDNAVGRIACQRRQGQRAKTAGAERASISRRVNGGFKIAATVHGDGLRNEDEFFQVQQHVREVGPDGEVGGDLRR